MSVSTFGSTVRRTPTDATVSRATNPTTPQAWRAEPLTIPARADWNACSMAPPFSPSAIATASASLGAWLKRCVAQGRRLDPRTVRGVDRPLCEAGDQVDGERVGAGRQGAAHHVDGGTVAD